MKNIYLKLKLFLILTFNCAIVFSSPITINGISYNTISSNTAEVTRPEKRGQEYEGYITIPSSIVHNGNSYRITAIGDYAFNYAGITGISLPEGIERIGKSAFNNNSLTNVIIPNSVKFIEESAFEGCGITNLIIGSGVNSIDKYAFAGNPIKEIIIPDNVTNIGEGAFLYNWLAEKIVLGKNVEYIGKDAFCKCAEVTELYIPNSVKDIGRYAFQAMNKLTKFEIDCDTIKNWFNYPELYFTDLIIGENVEEISSEAFYMCENIERLTISKNVRKIDEYAFYGCWKITDIYSHILAENLFEISNTVFEFEKTYCTLHIPFGSKRTYANTPCWDEFFNINEDEDTGIDKLHKKTNDTSIYDLAGKKTVPTRCGIYIVNGKKRLVNK